MRYLLLVVLSILTSSAFANDAIIGAGATTCGKWVKNRKTDAYYHQLNWVLGYISAYNNYVNTDSSEYGVIGNADSDSIAAWMDNYCQKNPLDTIAKGSVELIKVLDSHTK